MLKKVLLGLAGLLVVLLVVIFTRPDTYRVERTIEINAPAQVVFSHVNDFHHWEQWSPWDKLDPKMARSFKGPASGSGAIYEWVGNDDVGEGRMTIVASQPFEKIAINLEFIKPIASTSHTEFAFKANGPETTAVWIMVGNNNFIGKAMSLFMDFEKMIGPDFEKGLSALKRISEADAAAKADVAAASPAQAGARAATGDDAPAPQPAAADKPSP